jgi:hypothetical protein
MREVDGGAQVLVPVAVDAAPALATPLPVARPRVAGSYRCGMYAQPNLMPWVQALREDVPASTTPTSTWGCAIRQDFRRPRKRHSTALEQVDSSALIFPLKEPAGYGSANRHLLEVAEAHPDPLRMRPAWIRATTPSAKPSAVWTLKKHGATRRHLRFEAQAPDNQPRCLARGERHRGRVGSTSDPEAGGPAAASDDTESDPESRLLVREQLDSVLVALPTLTDLERAALSAGLCALTNGQLAEALHVTRKATSQSGYRVRRKLAKAPPRAA